MYPKTVINTIHAILDIAITPVGTGPLTPPGENTILPLISAMKSWNCRKPTSIFGLFLAHSTRAPFDVRICFQHRVCADGALSTETGVYVSLLSC